MPPRRRSGQVGLDPSFLDREATELSGGEAQRVCLARTLVTEPEMVLMDEVTSSVDPAQRLGLEELARSLASKRSGGPVGDARSRPDAPGRRSRSRRHRRTIAHASHPAEVDKRRPSNGAGLSLPVRP